MNFLLIKNISGSYFYFYNKFDFHIYSNWCYKSYRYPEQKYGKKRTLFVCSDVELLYIEKAPSIGLSEGYYIGPSGNSRSRHLPLPSLSENCWKAIFKDFFSSVKGENIRFRLAWIYILSKQHSGQKVNTNKLIH